LEPIIQKPLPPYPFTKTIDTLRGAAREISILEDLSRSVKEDKYLTITNIHRYGDISMTSTAGAYYDQGSMKIEVEKEAEKEDLALFKAKTVQLHDARDKLQNGVKQATDRLAKERSFHQSLMQLQKDWTVSPNHQATHGRRKRVDLYTIDLGSETSPLPQYKHVPVTVIRRHDNTLDLALSSLATYGRRVLLASAISQSNPTIENYSDILRNSQNSVLDQEIFDLLHLTCGKLPDTFTILERTDHRIHIQLKTYLTSKKQKSIRFRLVQQGYFKSLSVQIGSHSTDEFEESPMAVTQLQQTLLDVRDQYRKLMIKSELYHPRLAPLESNIETELCATIEKAISHIYHRLICENVIKKIVGTNTVNGGKLSVVQTEYPDYTAIQLSPETVAHIRGIRVDLQKTSKTIPFKSAEELVFFLNK
jgi:hypothetical protein